MYLTELRERLLKEDKKHSALSIMVKHAQSCKFRSYFFQWVQYSEQHYIHEENEWGTGPVSMERWHLRMKNYNLSSRIIADGKDQEFIDDIKMRTEARYK